MRTSPRDIVYVIASMITGGTQTHLLQVLRFLDRARYRPRLFCLRDGGDLAPHARALGIALDLTPRIRPLEEHTVEGSREAKILLTDISGVLADEPPAPLLSVGAPPPRVPLLVRVREELTKAARDLSVRALVLRLNTPGGTVTSSDIVFREVETYRREARVPVVAVMMDVAASGGYYVALPAVRILAHPTTVTGSVGVIFVRPKVAGLLEKMGAGVEVSKSGALKDLGSPFRATTADETAIFQEMTDRLARRFLDLVRTHRGLGPAELETVASARIFLAEEARALKLVDAVGYMPDALAAARGLAGLAEDARVVVYRRTEFPDDNVYNPVTSYEGSRPVALVETGLSNLIPALAPGFHYLWLPDVLVTTCPACIIQLSYGVRRHGLKVAVKHLTEVL